MTRTYGQVVTIDLGETFFNLQSLTLQGTNTLKYCEDFLKRVRQHKTVIEQYIRAYSVDPKRGPAGDSDFNINYLFWDGTRNQ